MAAEAEEVIMEAAICKTGDLFIDEQGKYSGFLEKCNDNRDELERLFRYDFGPEHAGFWGLRCRKCEAERGHSPPARMAEYWFDCKKAWVPTRARCEVCGTRWDLKIRCVVPADAEPVTIN